MDENDTSGVRRVCECGYCLLAEHVKQLRREAAELHRQQRQLATAALRALVEPPLDRRKYRAAKRRLLEHESKLEPAIKRLVAAEADLDFALALERYGDEHVRTDFVS